MTTSILSSPIDAFDVSASIKLNFTLDQWLRMRARLKWLEKEKADYYLEHEEEEEMKALKFFLYWTE